MAYIEPNSTIKLLTNCPLDNTYDHTIYFASASAQASYFESLVKFSYLNYSYVRKNRILKVQAPAGSNLYDCNYLMFKNTSFENKWFYAFVTHVEYDNNLTWLVEFELDVMQTWMFDYQLEECFVEREHSVTDAIGDNLVPENLELGEYVNNGMTKCHDGESNADDSYLKNLSLVFACTFNYSNQSPQQDPDGWSDFKGGYYGGLYSGLRFKDFPFPTPPTTQNIQSFVGNVNTFIEHSVSAGKVDGIVSAFVMPTEFISSMTSTHKRVGFSKTKAYNNIDGYIPKNKKLFTYPYNFLYVTNFQGQNNAYMYEYFNLDTCGFALEANFAPDPNIVLSPLGYKGSGLSNYDEKMTLAGYPQLPYATDVFKAWLANGAGSTIIGALSSVGQSALTGAIAGGAFGAIAGGGVGALPGAIIGAGISGFSAVANVMCTTREKAIAPAQAHNGAGSSAMCAVRLLDFGFMNKHIRAEFAKQIDDYFNMFGYATHRCKVPNTHVRPHWTYTKTVGCCIVGSVPAEDTKAICSIYNKGITFWRYGSEVGNYSLDNRPA